MRPPLSIADLFVKDSRLISSSESFTFGEWTLSSKNVLCPPVEAVETAFASVPIRDTLGVALTFNADSFTVNCREAAKLRDFLDQIRTQIRVKEPEDEIRITITINKSIRDNIVSMYSLETFLQSQAAKSISELFAVFGPLCNSDATVAVESAGDFPNFGTKTIVSGREARPDTGCVRRDELRSKRSEVAHFQGDDFQTLPDDFFLTKRSQSEGLNQLFDKLCFASCISFLADISELSPSGKRDVLWFKLNGYRTLSGNLDLAHVEEASVSEFFKIYEWVYSGGGISDKVGLTRNIVSLHWKPPSTSIEPGIFYSVRSGFEIYLKRNVGRYIDVKNRLTDFLSEFTQKGNKLAENLSDKLEKNFVAFVGFFISSVILKVLTDKTFIGVLTPSLAIVALIIIGFSAIHLVVTLLIFNKDKARLEEDYNALRMRYTDLLDAEDLANIFTKAGGTDKLSKYLSFKRNLFVGGWLLSLIVFLVLVLMFTQWRPETASGQSGPTNSISNARITPTNHSGTTGNFQAGAAATTNQAGQSLSGKATTRTNASPP